MRVSATSERLTRDRECERILMLSTGERPDGYETAYRALDVQFKLLHNRAQVLLGICGVLVSTSVLLMTTKLALRSHVVHARWVTPLLLAAGVAAISSAAIVVAAVLRIKWTTELPGADLRSWIMTSLRYRDSKTRAYRVATVVLLLSMALFQSAAVLAWLY